MWTAEVKCPLGRLKPSLENRPGMPRVVFPQHPSESHVQWHVGLTPDSHQQGCPQRGLFTSLILTQLTVLTFILLRVLLSLRMGLEHGTPPVFRQLGPCGSLPAW